MLSWFIHAYSYCNLMLHVWLKEVTIEKEDSQLLVLDSFSELTLNNFHLNCSR